jgi:hypothetical protein
MIAQHPNRDTTAYDTIPAALRPIASSLGVTLSTYAFDTFIAAGKPSGWYNSDGIHESPGLGCVPYITGLNQWWDSAVAAPAKLRNSRFLSGSAENQLLTNGNFATWSNTSAAPDGWSTQGTIAFSKDTAVYADGRKPWSVRCLSSGAGLLALPSPFQVSGNGCHVRSPSQEGYRKQHCNAGKAEHRMEWTLSRKHNFCRFPQPHRLAHQFNAWWFRVVGDFCVHSR